MAGCIGRCNMILKNVRLWDGTGRVWERADIVIADGRIACISAEPVPVEDQEIIDLAGKTIIPGLINAHVHLCLDASAGDPENAWYRRTLTENVLIAARQAREALRAGVTTVRDLGGIDYVDLGLKRAIEGGLVPGPRILASGKLITMTGGHGHRFGREADGPDECRQAAREQLKAGADVIKVMATGGVMTLGTEPGAAQLTSEEMAAAISEAHKAGKGTAAHAQGTTGIMNALRAAVDSIEHGFYLDEATIALMVERGTFFVPTLAALKRIIEFGAEAGIPAFMVEKAKRAVDAQLDSFQRAWRAGVKIGAGNDGGSPMNPHGDVATELELLVRAGLSLAQALTAATRANAELLRLPDLGTVEPGKLADLVVLSGDPLADISAVRSVAMVIKSGQVCTFHGE